MHAQQQISICLCICIYIYICVYVHVPVYYVLCAHRSMKCHSIVYKFCVRFLYAILSCMIFFSKPEIIILLFFKYKCDDSMNNDINVLCYV